MCVNCSHFSLTFGKMMKDAHDDERFHAMYLYEDGIDLIRHSELAERWERHGGLS